MRNLFGKVVATLRSFGGELSPAPASEPGARQPAETDTRKKKPRNLKAKTGRPGKSAKVESTTSKPKEPDARLLRAEREHLKAIKAKLNADAEAERERREAIADLREAVAPHLSTIVEHLSALRVRRSQLVNSDHYGNAVLTAWHDEIDYFIRRTLLRDDAGRWEKLKSSCQPYPEARYLRLKHTIDLIAQNADLAVPKESRDDVSWSDLEPLEFERHCCESLVAVGWHARTTAATGDQGIDVIAIHGNQKLVVQCKRYAGTVGNKAVQEIIAGRTFERADLAAVVSTGSFTPAARQLAAASDVSLLHPSQIRSFYGRKAPASEAEIRSMSTAQLIDEVLREVHAAEKRILPRLRYGTDNALAGAAPLSGSVPGGSDLDELDDDEPVGDDEDLYRQAIAVLKSTKRASTSMLQRRLRIGYSHAERLMEIMEEKGIVGPENGSSPREILVDLDTL